MHNIDTMKVAKSLLWSITILIVFNILLNIWLYYSVSYIPEAGAENAEPINQGHHTPQEIKKVAEAAAKDAGYELEKYNITGCIYEYTKKNGTWSVFFVRKPPTPPGGHFLVFVHDKTLETTVHRGK